MEWIAVVAEVDKIVAESDAAAAAVAEVDKIVVDCEGNSATTRWTIKTL
jgi:hypothetical protein